ncbi:MAG: hypothetical protein K0S78_962 [Thermomicrobiales bacterium]|jgi:hypothetical protein|nr:hypothetical protein [Thermomicrobiales bacterium]MDF3038140.1 hypothetical protein [Thermomicrobiales bacterium]
MADGRTPDPETLAPVDQTLDDAESVLTTPEDVASAGRSCMAIVVLGTIIVLLLAIWIVYRTVGG